MKPNQNQSVALAFSAINSIQAPGRDSAVYYALGGLEALLNDGTIKGHAKGRLLNMLTLAAAYGQEQGQKERDRKERIGS